MAKVLPPAAEQLERVAKAFAVERVAAHAGPNVITHMLRREMCFYFAQGRDAPQRKSSFNLRTASCNVMRQAKAHQREINLLRCEHVMQLTEASRAATEQPKAQAAAHEQVMADRQVKT